MKLQNFLFRGRPVWLKRDDIFKLYSGKNGTSTNVTGNKARKFKKLANHLNQTDVPISLFSYGGYQSNSMAALSKLVTFCNQKRETKNKTTFTYFIKSKIPLWLQNCPSGNYQTALCNGTRFVALSSSIFDKLHERRHTEPTSFLKSLALKDNGSPFIQNLSYPEHGQVRQKFKPLKSQNIWIPQGGAYVDAYTGIADMINEVVDELVDSRTMTEKIKNWVILIASGTGTTAYFATQQVHRRNCCLRKVANIFCKYMRYYIAITLSKFMTRPPSHMQAGLTLEVVAIPCIGNYTDLKSQIESLHREFKFKYPELNVIDNFRREPIKILAPHQNEHFATPRRELMKVWKEIEVRLVEV